MQVLWADSEVLASLNSFSTAILLASSLKTNGGTFQASPSGSEAPHLCLWYLGACCPHNSSSSTLSFQERLATSSISEGMTSIGMVWSGSSSSSMVEVASEEEESLWDQDGPDPDGGVSPPPVVGSPHRGAMDLTVAEVALCPCSWRVSEYLSQAFS